MVRTLSTITAALLGFALATTTASALPTCADLATNPAWGIAGHPQLSAASTTLVPASGSNAAYCQVNLTVASQAGRRAPYPQHAS